MEQGRISRILAGAGDALVSVFFPAECRLCEQLLTRAKRLPVCDKCLAGFKPTAGPICEICGEPLPAGFGGSGTPPSQGHQKGAGDRHGTLVTVCRPCQLRKYAFERARSYASYEGGLARAIVMLKFERIYPLAEWFTERLTEVAVREELEADVVVPVPLHRQREKERGYNQADLIAKPLAKRLKLSYLPVLLVRKRPRPDKHILTLRERWESVRGAFATRPGSQVDNLRVLLVDDVLTTGATLDACAKVLREAGAKSVVGLTIARAARRPAVVTV